MALCSPALSLCGIIISAWGVIQLILMGFFYFIESLALSEDLPLENADVNHHYFDAAERAYARNAHNCWIAACLYVFTLAVSVHQFYLNNRSSINM